MSTDTIQIVARLAAVGIFLLVGFPVHEFSHALAAFRLGDSTARWQGRLTLDPRRHFDPIGGGLLALSALVGGFFIGWAKPTPVNPVNLQGGRRGEAIVAAAGPLSNLVMAAIAAVALRVFLAVDVIPGLKDGLILERPGVVAGLVYYVLSAFVLINVFLFIFNLLPVPPLDGYRVLLGLVNSRTAWQLRQYEQYGLMLILVIFLLAGPVIGPVGIRLYEFLAGQPLYSLPI